MPEATICRVCGHPLAWHSLKRGCRQAHTVRKGQDVAVIICGCMQWGEWSPLSTTDGRQEVPFGDYLIEDGIPRFGFSRVGVKAAGHLLDGREWQQMPEVRR